jgi:hypothetical protein
MRTSLAICLALLTSASFAADDALKPILELQKSNKLFDKAEYKTIRTASAQVYETRHKDLIAEAFGDDAAALRSWFEKNRDIKEELFTAIQWEKDDVPQVLALFRKMWKANPEAVAKYPNLAIAIAVVWDNPRNLYDYRGHQVRTQSKLPENHMAFGPMDEFQYHIDHQKAIKGKEAFDRLQVLPWEFLVYAVDTRTPISEREWALKGYIDKRKMIGKIYHDVEYDQEMLKTQSKVCKLNDKDYTLKDILKYGGVCAMQADFAARVGKSLGVPAAYVGAEGKYLGRHAWVMWVEIQSATATNVKFTLESWGRYLGDNYYTGELRDPQTGEKILDRDMERRLSAAAADRIGKRQAELAMGFYNDIVAETKPELKAKIAYLDGILKLSNLNEGAWLELAKIAASGDVPASLKENLFTHTERLLTVFEKYPDFTWKVGGDLISIQKDPLQRNRFYERLAVMYEKGNRPDLACEARLKWADFLGEASKWQLAATGLNYSIMRFPDEGRYVPAMLGKLKESCSNYKTGNEYLAKTYVDLLRKIPAKRGSEVSQYFVQVAKEAMEFLKREKKDKQLREIESIVAANGVKFTAE